MQKKANKAKYVFFLALGLAAWVRPAVAQDAVSEQHIAQASETSRDSLFGVSSSSESGKQGGAASDWRGFVQTEAARAYQSPDHWSKARLRIELSRQGRLSENVRWKISGRADYDAAYDRSHYYPGPVRDDQRYDFMLRETYLDIGAGDWDFRLGRQHIVWGEMVGLFFADVVSAKDMREFLLPEFEQLRVPQWAALASYTKSNTHLDLLWVPVPSYDNIGKPGGDFYPYPLPVPAHYLGEQRPARKLSNSNYGLRISHLSNGWDISGFYYHSIDAAPTFYRLALPAAPGAPYLFQARHERINQFGGTVSKDLGKVVFKGEVVYTDGRQYNMATSVAQPNGLVKQDTLDYAVGFDFTFGSDSRLNLQAFQRVFFAHNPDIIPDRFESGASLFLSTKFARNVEAQTLFVHSLNRSDWMLRPRVTWNFEKNWRLAVGADVFGGPVTGFFGRYNNSDRVYVELRYTF